MVHDLFASMPEWVADWYDPFFYAAPAEKGNTSQSPRGPATPIEARVEHEYGGGNVTAAHGGFVVRGYRWSLHGGAGWTTKALGSPGWFREERQSDVGAGFRCARDDGGPRPGTVPRYTGLQWNAVPERRRRP